MRVLIVENEVYLARSISAKLSSIGYECFLVSSIKEALKDEKYDIVLLSTNILGQNIYPVIKKHSKSIIILMISYISNDTVIKPLKAGADEYIQKPFMIEELIRKLEHLREYYSLKQKNEMLEDYVKESLAEIDDFRIDKKLKLPILLRSNMQKNADAYMFQLSKILNKNFKIISLSHKDSIKKLLLNENNTITYLINLQHIKKSDKMKLVEMIQDKQVVISSTDVSEDIPIETIDLKVSDDVFHNGDILSIENYVRFVISNFQSRFPDTELSKKLGISRKSLWERRKKYGINKEK